MSPWHEVLHLMCPGLEVLLGLVMHASYIFCHFLRVLTGPVWVQQVVGMLGSLIGVVRACVV
jgi:hypothetical protein